MRNFVAGHPEVKIALNEDFFVGKSDVVSRGKMTTLAHPSLKDKYDPNHEFKQVFFMIQSNLWLQPPLISDQFSKIPKVCKSNHYIWNLL